jgi:hypothetical protein
MNYEHEYMSLDTCPLASFREKALSCEHEHSDRMPKFSDLRFLFDMSQVRFPTGGHFYPTMFL